MVTTIASRNSYSERRFLKRDWQIISYRICTMNCLISPLLLCRTDSNPSIAASTSIANIETIFIKSSYIKSAPICIGCASSCLRDRKNIVNNVKSYRESNCISTSSPLFIQPRVRYKGYHRNSCSNNQKRLLLMSNLRDDNDRYFQWCCCERYLQRHNTL